MSSSYKPKLLEIFLNEKEDSLPQLVEIRHVPQRDQQHEEGSRKRKDQLIDYDDRRLDLSAYKHDSVGRGKNNQSFNSEENEYQKTSKRLTTQLGELELRLKDERRKGLIYEQKIQDLQTMVDKAKLKMKQYETKIDELQRQNETLTICKEGLQKQIRELRLVESSQFNSYSKNQPAQYKKQIFDKLETYLKRLIQNFIQSLKPQRINKSVEDKIEEFLSQLLQINSQSIEVSNKSKYSNKVLHKYSYSESPIADQSSYIDTKHKFEYSPFKQSRYQNESDRFIDQSKTKFTEKERSIVEKYPKKYSEESHHSDHLPRFNFIKQSVDPTINDQSAFVSISHIGKSSIERSYERNDRSRSQRRRKIFE